MVSHPSGLPLSHSQRMCLGSTLWGALAGCPILATSTLPARQPHPAAFPGSPCCGDILPALPACRCAPGGLVLLSKYWNGSLPVVEWWLALGTGALPPGPSP